MDMFTLQCHLQKEHPCGSCQRTLGLMALAVTTYTSFVSHLAEVRNSNVDELAPLYRPGCQLSAEYVRAFLGELPDGTNLDATIYENISDCLNLASEYATSVGVKIAVEPHDNFPVHPLSFQFLINLTLTCA